MPSKLHLANKPTPLWHNDALDRLVGCEVWVKRDDMTGGAEAGNKIRKLEYLLADAVDQGADTVITCGAAQSNHARATSLVARRLGLDSILLLRTSDAEAEPNTGNLRLSRMSGATIRFISPEQYADRDRLMHAESEQLVERGRKPYVIVEGGSSGLGALGYVDAVAELLEQQQLDLCPMSFDTIVCACGSGGTAAGLSLGVGRYGTARRVDAVAVCDDTAAFEAITTRICDEARALRPDLPLTSNLIIHDAYRGPAYGEMSQAQREFLDQVAASSGLVLDPVYSGKALFGLAQLDPKPRLALFVHTGGLPGTLA